MRRGAYVCLVTRPDDHNQRFIQQLSELSQMHGVGGYLTTKTAEHPCCAISQSKNIELKRLPIRP